jgi:hypothetical protein
VGLLFGAFEPAVERVLLIDARRPRSFDVLLAAAAEVAPWLPAKVTFLTADVTRLPGGGAHAHTAAAAALRRPPGGQHSESMHARARDVGDSGAANDPNDADDADASSRRDDTEVAAALLRGTAPGRAGFVAVYACGALTDACIGVAAAARGPLAALPCCFTGAAAGAPGGARRLLGVGVAADVARMYRLEQEGFTCDFAALPRAITPMNRALVAVPRRRGGDDVATEHVRVDVSEE